MRTPVFKRIYYFMRIHVDLNYKTHTHEYMTSPWRTTLAPSTICIIFYVFQSKLSCFPPPPPKKKKREILCFSFIFLWFSIKLKNEKLYFSGFSKWYKFTIIDCLMVSCEGFLNISIYLKAITFNKTHWFLQRSFFKSKVFSGNFPLSRGTILASNVCLNISFPSQRA